MAEGPGKGKLFTSLQPGSKEEEEEGARFKICRRPIVFASIWF
jgi:hypothetical protein